MCLLRFRLNLINRFDLYMTSPCLDLRCIAFQWFSITATHYKVLKRQCQERGEGPECQYNLEALRDLLLKPASAKRKQYGVSGIYPLAIGKKLNVAILWSLYHIRLMWEIIPRPKLDDQQTSTPWFYWEKGNVWISLMAQNNIFLSIFLLELTSKRVFDKRRKK